MTIEDLCTNLTASREYLLRHLRGITPMQLDVRPSGFPRSAREICKHMLENDGSCFESLGVAAPVFDDSDPLRSLSESNAALVNELRTNWVRRGDEAFLALSGDGDGIAQGVTYRQMEDCYHAGQLAWIRLSFQPDWEYYGDVYAPFRG